MGDQLPMAVEWLAPENDVEAEPSTKEGNLPFLNRRAYFTGGHRGHAHVPTDDKREGIPRLVQKQRCSDHSRKSLVTPKKPPKSYGPKGGATTGTTAPPRAAPSSTTPTPAAPASGNWGGQSWWDNSDSTRRAPLKRLRISLRAGLRPGRKGIVDVRLSRGRKHLRAVRGQQRVGARKMYI